MRLAFLSHEFPPLGGGGASALDFLTRKLAQRNHPVLIVTIARGAGRGIQRDELGRRLVFLGAGRKSFFAPSTAELARSYLALRVRAGTWLARFKPEVVVAFFAFPSGHAALGPARALGVPLVVWLRGSDLPGFNDARWGWAKPVRKHLLRATWKGTDLLLTNGSHLAGLAADLRPRRRLLSLPNGVETGLFHPPSSLNPHRPLRALFVGQMIDRKRCLEILEGLLWLGRQGHELEISLVGQGPLLAEIERRRAYLPKSISLSILGRVSRQEMPEVYRNHDLLLLLSRAEGISNVLLEALASGLCVLATPSAAAEVVTHGKEGWLIDDLTPSGLGQALMKMAARPQEVMAMRERARALAETMSWDERTDRFLRLTGELARTGPPDCL